MIYAGTRLESDLPSVINSLMLRATWEQGEDLLPGMEKRKGRTERSLAVTQYYVKGQIGYFIKGYLKFH